MKNFLRSFWVGIAALTVISTVAFAATIFQERPDGFAVFTRTPSGNQYVVGRQVLSAQFADIASASTIHVASDVDGVITGWSSVINNAITSANCTLSLVYNADTAKQSNITVTQSGSAAGDYDSVSGLSIAVTAGGKIAITSDGTCNTTTITPVKVFVDPR